MVSFEREKEKERNERFKLYKRKRMEDYIELMVSIRADERLYGSPAMAGFGFSDKSNQP